MNNMERNQAILKSKQHFVLLDGLRGVAALGIVIFHFMEWIFTDPSQNFIGHGFLAVDFFFCLSGFVIGYAYDDRIQKMGIKEFLKSRLIRLHPLVILGAVLGLLGYFIDPFAFASTTDNSTIVLLFLSALLLIPLPIMQERAYNMFAFNAPAWSLFWEYIANIVYALVLCRLGRRTLMALTVFAAAGIIYVSHIAGNLLGGWSKDNWLHGGARVAYSFLAGLLIYRCNWIIKNNLGFMVLAVLLCAAFLTPSIAKYNWIIESIVVLVYFPLIVSLGAGSNLSERVRPICKFSGDISYPLYMTHYAGIWVFGNYLTGRKPSMEQLTWIIVFSTIALIVFAYLVMKLYDIPIRKYLTKRRHESVSRLEN